MEPNSKPFLKPAIYDFLKKLVQLVLPAVTTLYLGLAQVWEFPNPEKVALTIGLVTTFLGVCLGISKSAYDKSDLKFDGDVMVGKTETGTTRLSLELNKDPFVLAKKDQLMLRKVEVDPEYWKTQDDAA